MTGCELALEPGGKNVYDRFDNPVLEDTMSNWEQLKSDAQFLRDNVARAHERDQEFIRSLLAQFEDRGLSQKQEYWVGEMATRLRKRLNAQDAQQSSQRVADSLAPIAKLFATAQTHLKRPFVLISSDAGQLRLKVVTQGQNAGCVYVYRDGPYEDRDYWGKVTQDGRYVPSREIGSEQTAVAEALRLFAKDPAGAAARFGRSTGACCFCGKTLTDERSVAVGYGPICADHYGLPWGEGAVVETQPLPASAYRDSRDPTEELGYRGSAFTAEVVEYAGFRYEMRNGHAHPLPGQHPAAHKERHCRAAEDEYAQLRARKRKLEREAYENRPKGRLASNSGVPFDDDIPF